MNLKNKSVSRMAAAVLLPLVVLAVSGLGAAALINSRPDAPQQPREPIVPAVRVIEAGVQDVRLTVATQGTVEPRRQMTLVPQVSGRVIEAAPSFAAGGFFEADEVLVRIEPRDYDLAIVRAQAGLAEAELRLRQAEAAAEQAKREWAELGRGEPTALAARQPQLAEAQARVAAAEAALDEAKLNRERTEIRAPFAGRVRQKQVDLGQYVSPGVTLATLYSVDYAEVRLPLSDADLRFIDLPLSFRGEPEWGRPPSRPAGRDARPTAHQPLVTLRAMFAGRQHEWTGRIVRTEGTIDPGSRMLYAVAQVEDPYARDASAPDRPPLKVGMFVQAEIEGRLADKAVVLPRASVRANDEVLVVDEENRLRVRPVEVLRSDRQRVILTSGVKPGEKVSVSLIETVVEGMRVKPVMETAGVQMTKLE